MLALSPTPLVIWPLPPQVAVPGGVPQFSGPPMMGLFNMLREKLNPGSVFCWFCATVVPLAFVQPAAALQTGPPPIPPASRSLHMFQTLCVVRFALSLNTTAAVQLENAVQ